MNYGQVTGDLETVPIFKTKCVCIIPVDHQLASKECIYPQDLVDENFITFSAGTSLRLEIDNFFSKEKVQPKIVCETDLGISACALVSGKLGVSLINPISAKEESKDSRIAIRPISPDIVVTLSLVFPPHRLRSNLINRFVDYVQLAAKQELDYVPLLH